MVLRSRHCFLIVRHITRWREQHLCRSVEEGTEAVSSGSVLTEETGIMEC